MAAAKAFFRSAKAVTGVTPARVTTDGHDSYPRAIRTELDAGVKHRTNQYLNTLLSGQLSNRFNWLPFIASSELSVVCKITDSIEAFSNTVTENTCINV